MYKKEEIKEEIRKAQVSGEKELRTTHALVSIAMLLYNEKCEE